MEKRLTPIKAIREHCIDCCGGELKEVRLCAFTDCALWVYRMGHRPKEEGFDEDNESDLPDISAN